MIPDNPADIFSSQKFVLITTLILSLAGTVLAKLFIDSTAEENRIMGLRKKILNKIRLKISDSLSRLIPPKQAKIKDQDYRALCTEHIHNYFSNSEDVLSDIINCQHLFNRYKFTIRFHKYFTMILPIISWIVIVAYCIFADPFKISAVFIIAFFTIVLLVIIWCINERRKDIFQDFCVKLEVTDEE